VKVTRPHVRLCPHQAVFKLSILIQIAGQKGGGTTYQKDHLAGIKIFTVLVNNLEGIYTLVVVAFYLKFIVKELI